MKICIGDVKRIIHEALEEDLDDKIEAIRKEPNFSSVSAFMSAKFDDDDYEYDFIELQTLARNATSKRKGIKLISMASDVDIAAIKKELNDMGFKFIGRQPSKKVRGFTSNAHGTHPFAGSGGGGSGFGSDFAGSTHTAFGGGPGAIGGGYTWDPNDKKNLPMGAKRKKR